MSSFDMIGEMLESEHAVYVEMEYIVKKDFEDGDVDIQMYFDRFVTMLITHPRYVFDYIPDIVKAIDVIVKKGNESDSLPLRSPDLLYPTFGVESNLIDDASSYELRGLLIDMFASGHYASEGLLVGTDVDRVDWTYVRSEKWYLHEDTKKSTPELRLSCIKQESRYLGGNPSERTKKMEEDAGIDIEFSDSE